MPDRAPEWLEKAVHELVERARAEGFGSITLEVRSDGAVELTTANGSGWPTGKVARLYVDGDTGTRAPLVWEQGSQLTRVGEAVRRG